MACSKEPEDELSLENYRVLDEIDYEIGEPILFPLLHSAVVRNDVERMKEIIKSGVSVNMMDRKQRMPLYLAVFKDRQNAFDYLISLNDIEIDFKVERMTLLLWSLYHEANKHYALNLINKGADVNEAYLGSTCLHFAVSNYDDADVGQILIERGADINARDSHGQTPLALACSIGNEEIIYMLLCLGADSTVGDEDGILPYALSLLGCPEELQEILFNYTFADENVEILVHLNSFRDTFSVSSPCLQKMIEKTTEVVYGFERELTDMFRCVLGQLVIRRKNLPRNLELFKKFCTKFKNIATVMFTRAISLTQVILFGEVEYSVALDLICFLCENDVMFRFDQWSLVDCLGKRKDAAELMYYLLSYGFDISFFIIKRIYKRFGYCELFEILLHMEISDLRDNLTSIPSLLCNLNVDASVISDGKCFAGNKDLKKLFATPEKVPSLLQLSREAARRCIIQKHNVKKNSHFYAILKYLPINQVYKDILS